METVVVASSISHGHVNVAIVLEARDLDETIIWAVIGANFIVICFYKPVKQQLFVRVLRAPPWILRHSFSSAEKDNNKHVEIERCARA